MNKLLEYPFDPKEILRKKKSIKRELLQNENLLEKKIAVFGGSTTNEIVNILELFLLNYGIRPVFYESEYGQYWQDAMFGNDEIRALKPDIVYIHTSNRNIKWYPSITDEEEIVNDKLNKEYNHYEEMWEKIASEYGCTVIQNNFELPYFRLLGNQDAVNIHGRVNYISRLNAKFTEYAQKHSNFYINDINYQSALYGVEKWSDPFFWHMYKYALNMDAIPYLAYNVANMIKSLYGKNKKALAIDLDNTLWGGVIGDDGVNNLEIGNETSIGQAYVEFQNYLKCLKEQGILLNIISKNDYDNAVSGLTHPEMILKKDDFVKIIANWEPKSSNLIQMAKELQLLPESFVFVDDNPAEREIVRQQVEGVGIPDMQKVEYYISAIDRAGYFEAMNVSSDDLKRNEMYKLNALREEQQSNFDNYGDFLKSLNMKAEIKEFEDLYMSRIAQLTNKSNQFNLTTKRFTQDEIESIAKDENYETFYGRLEDTFGDNGIVSIVIGKKDGKKLDIILWLMSCRVLKRDMEFAMMDEVAHRAKKIGIEEIYGYYYPTAKNSMVKDFYEIQGFSKVSEDVESNTKWVLDIREEYVNKNKYIEINR